MKNQAKMLAERAAEGFFKRFRPQMESIEHSPLARARSLTVNDYNMLGRMLAQYEDYTDFVKEAGTANDLGVLPRVALDVITGFYGASVIPLIASVQPIEEEQGTVYYKQVKATATRGNVTANQVFRDALAAPGVYPQGYAGEIVSGVTLVSATVDETLTYSGASISGMTVPIRPNTVYIYMVGSESSVYGRDDGNGNIMGVGMQGTINYSTGAWVVSLLTNPGAAEVVKIDAGSDFEAGATIPKINSGNASTSVRAETFVLGSDTGLFKAFAQQKRFGISAQDEVIQDLTNELTQEVGNTLVARMIAAVPTANGVSWSKTHTNYSWTEHKQELKSQIGTVEGKILKTAGRGIVTSLLVTPDSLHLITDLPGFTRVANAASGPQLIGDLDGLPVVRCPSLSGEVIYPLYRGTGAFDAPAAFAPFMPLFVTGSIPTSNPTVATGLAAMWAGLKVMVPGFMGKITVTA